MNQKITLYHGSEQIVESPTFGLGKQNNDFGLGFYCTESEELAKEWAVSSLRNGFVNRYSLDTEYLKILNLNSPDYTILNCSGSASSVFYQKPSRTAGKTIFDRQFRHQCQCL